MQLVHLTASTFYGGPERQMLGLGRALPKSIRSTYLTFSEGGRCSAFLDQLDAAGLDAFELHRDTPNLRSAIREIATFLSDRRADVLITHGYKSNLLGRIAARRVGVPIITVSRGWTGESFKVRIYEKLDRYNLRYMDAIVAVSEGQATKVRATGISEEKLTIIRNAARLDAFATPRPQYRDNLRELAKAKNDEITIVAAGRLSPEKGFDVLVEAAAITRDRNTGARFVLFGDGAQRPELEKRIAQLKLQDRFVLAGFRDDLDCWLPWADVVVLPSFTEGLPNVALEASAASIPVVATAVGGTPEVVRDGETGYLVPSGNPNALAERIVKLSGDRNLRRTMGETGRRLMEDSFSFAAQARAYQQLLDKVVPTNAVALKRAA